MFDMKHADLIFMPSLPTLLEDLPDELLLQVISFARSSDVFRCLINQNDRFRRIVCDYQSLHVDMTPEDIQVEHIQNLQRFLQPERILHLSLSSRVAFGQIHLFTRLFRRWDQFIQLRVLFLEMPTAIDTKRLIDALEHLVHLQTLKIDRIIGVDSSDEQRWIYERILSYPLPALRQVTLRISDEISYSNWSIQFDPLNHLEHLTIATVAINVIYILLENLPHLLSLNVTNMTLGYANSISLSEKVYSNVRSFSLEIVVLNNSRPLEHLFQYALLGLHYLSLRIIFIQNNELDGLHWSRLLQPLRQLKRFNCYFKHTSFYAPQQLNNYIELFNSYSTPFWLVEHRWPMHIIYCKNNITICSMPYRFSNLHIFNNDTESMITGEPLISKPYRYVKSLILSTETLSQRLSRTVPYFRFPQIDTVTLSVHQSVDRSLSRLIPIERVRRLKLLSNWARPIRIDTFFDSFFVRAHALRILHLSFNNFEQLSHSFIYHEPTCRWLSEHIHRLVLDSSQHNFLPADEFMALCRIFLGLRSFECRVKLLDEAYELARCAFNHMRYLIAFSVFVTYRKLPNNYGSIGPLRTIKHLSQGDHDRLTDFLRDRSRLRFVDHFDVHCEDDRIGIWL